MPTDPVLRVRGLSTIPLLRYVGLAATAWIAGELVAWAANGGGRTHFYGDLPSLVLTVTAWFVPVALALFWMWPPLARRESATLGVMIAGLVVTLVFVAGPRDPGAEYVDNWAWFTLVAGTAWYGFTAMFVWCCLWLVARALHRPPAT